jgi:alkylation response protein AidB-like acyl-CoA dehydrogenase
LLAETHKLGHIYGGKTGREFIKKFAANGWLVPNWPEEYGGIGSSAMLAFAIKEEMARSSVPLVFVAAHMSGPTIMHFASEEMKQEWLLPIARGEIEFALGYTEPQAGSDLSALNMLAEDKGDHFIVNGQKSFNTASHVADYHWLATLTDPEAKRYHGMSMMIDYAKGRKQFGKPVGAFQAIQHHCANMLTYLDTTKYLMYHAAWKISEDLSYEFEAAACKAWSSDSYLKLTALGHQVIGGLGFMEEYDLQLYFKNAKTAELLCGNADIHREIVACEMGL